MRRHGNPSRRTLEKLLTAAGSSLAEFEALRIGGAPRTNFADPAVKVTEHGGSPWRGGALPPLPVVAASPGGQWNADGATVELTQLHRGEIIDRVPRPAGLAADTGAFAFIVTSTAMWPRFRAGRRVAVSPRAEIETGDDVLVTLARETDGRSSTLVAELVERTAEQIVLRQYNPPITCPVATDSYASLHKILGELI
jgi:hypothetical protein